MKHNIFLILSFFIITSCGDKRDDYHDFYGAYTNAYITDKFVTALNATGQYNFDVAKANSNTNSYVVIYNRTTGEFSAIFIDGYNEGDNAVSYLNSAPTYHFLTPYFYSSGALFVDEVSGLGFEKDIEVSKDVEKYAALAEESIVSDRAVGVSDKFGLSIGRSKEVVRLAMAWERAGGKDLPDAEQDSYAREMLGFSIGEARAALSSKFQGDATPLEELINTAAELNRTTPEHVQELIEKYMSH